MPGDLTTSVAEFVASRPATKAADVASELGISDASARVYLGRLADAGTIQRVGRGVYGPASPERTSAEQAAASPFPEAETERNTDEDSNQPESTGPGHQSLVHSPDSETQQPDEADAPSPDATAGHNSTSEASPANATVSIPVAEVFTAPSWTCPFCGHRQADGRLPSCEDCGHPRDRETPR